MLGEGFTYAFKNSWQFGKQNNGVSDRLRQTKYPHQYPLRIPTSRTRRNADAQDATSKQYERNCVKKQYTEGKLPSVYIPPRILR